MMAVGAALVRPQFILIALALVAIGRVRAAIGAAGAFALVTLASFLVVPTGFTAALRQWVQNIVSFRSGSFTLTDPTPANISIARSVTSVGGWFADRPGPLGAFGRWVVEITVAHPVLPGLVLVALTATVFFLGRTHISRGVAVAVSFAVAKEYCSMRGSKIASRPGATMAASRAVNSLTSVKLAFITSRNSRASPAPRATDHSVAARVSSWR
jgi:hypothetical protein